MLASLNFLLPGVNSTEVSQSMENLADHQFYVVRIIYYYKMLYAELMCLKEFDIFIQINIRLNLIRYNHLVFITVCFLLLQCIDGWRSFMAFGIFLLLVPTCSSFQDFDSWFNTSNCMDNEQLVKRLHGVSFISSEMTF